MTDKDQEVPASEEDTEGQARRSVIAETEDDAEGHHGRNRLEEDDTEGHGGNIKR